MSSFFCVRNFHTVLRFFLKKKESEDMRPLCGWSETGQPLFALQRQLKVVFIFRTTCCSCTGEAVARSSTDQPDLEIFIETSAVAPGRPGQISHGKRTMCTLVGQKVAISKGNVAAKEAPNVKNGRGEGQEAENEES